MDTLKKRVIRGIATATQAEALRNNNVIITTALGLISGRAYTEGTTEKEEPGITVIAEFTKKIVEDYGAANIDGNDGFIMLKDVTVRTGSNTIFNIPSIVVFYDQIIGITFGNLE